MEYKKISALHKWYLKYTNKAAYNAYKKSRRKALEKQNDRLYGNMLEEKFISTTKLIKHPPPPETILGQVMRFKHSGNVGDIMYALPVIFALAGNKDIHLFLHSEQPIDNQNLQHPLGNVMLNDNMIHLLTPLLLQQPQIKLVKKFSGEVFDYDLDAFRHYSFGLDKGSIVRWYFLVHGVSYTTGKPWITVPKNNEFATTLVIARSQRYRSPLIDYSFLKSWPNKIFLGIEAEFLDMQKAIPDLVHKPVTDFLEMAVIINSCRLFIGNQSFPFSLAEALKSPRLLEVYYRAPNVIPEGAGANEFMYQPQFESMVSRLLNAPMH